jgi:hypothetical protein
MADTMVVRDEKVGMCRATSRFDRSNVCGLNQCKNQPPVVVLLFKMDYTVNLYK